jgi:UDPglucose 6-dehydrogenase
MVDDSVGVIGSGGFVGRAILRGFLTYNPVFGFDVDPKKSTHTLEEVLRCDFVFIAVPTPMVDVEGGKGDTSIIESVLSRIVEIGYDERTVFIIKSTVPIGTTDRCIDQFGISTLVHSPEFLTERTSNIDFINPARHIIGGRSAYAMQRLKGLYESRFKGIPCKLMPCKEAEHVKYMANSFFFNKVIFFNEQKMLSDAMETDWERTLEGMLLDGRIARSHTDVPGHDGQWGAGGKCLPKDINALMAVMIEYGVDPILLKAVWEQNKRIREKWDWADIEGAVSENRQED